MDVNLQPRERVRLCILTLVPGEKSQMVERTSHLRVVRTQDPLPHMERPLKKQFCLPVPSPLTEILSGLVGEGGEDGGFLSSFLVQTKERVREQALTLLPGGVPRCGEHFGKPRVERRRDSPCPLLSLFLRHGIQQNRLN